MYMIIARVSIISRGITGMGRGITRRRRLHNWYSLHLLQHIGHEALGQGALIHWTVAFSFKVPVKFLLILHGEGSALVSCDDGHRIMDLNGQAAALLSAVLVGQSFITS